MSFPVAGVRRVRRHLDEAPEPVY